MGLLEFFTHSLSFMYKSLDFLLGLAFMPCHWVPGKVFPVACLACLNIFMIWKDDFMTIPCFMAIWSLHFDVAAVKLENMMKLSVENTALKVIKICLDHQFTGNLGTERSTGKHASLFCIYDLISQNFIIFVTLGNPVPLKLLLFQRLSLRAITNLENSWVQFNPDEQW